MTRFRTSVVGLPLQMSTFDRLPEGPAILGLSTPSGLQHAGIADNGDLHLGRESMAVLANALGDALEEGYASELCEILDHSIVDLEDAIARARTAAGSLPDEAVRLLSNLGDALTVVITLVVLGKTLADVLFEAMRERGFSVIPPFPSPSPGAQLDADLHRLAEWCESHGHRPTKIAELWPNIERAVEERIVQFAADHVGFGPVAWEAPGFDDPRFVIQALQTTTSASDVLLSSIPRRDEPNDKEASAIYRALASWLLLMESGILVTRRAFYHGVIPLIRPASKFLGIEVADLPFVRFRETRTAEPPSTEEIDRRKERYRGSSTYFAFNGMDAERIDRLLARLA